ncbi:MAG: radical SAM protein [Fibrobacterota bacterium]
MARKRLVGETTPVIAYLEPTLRCNHRCVHCYVEQNIPQASEELSLLEINTLLDGLASLGALILVITGGEPLLRPDWPHILQAARKRGFAPVLFTNGSLINESVARALKELAVLGVEISFHGADAPTHDRVTGVTGSFVRAVNAVKLLKLQGIRVKAKGNLLNANKGDVNAMLALSETLGCEYTFDPLIYPCRDGADRPLAERLPDAGLARVYSDKRLVHAVKPRRRSYLEVPENRLCGAGANIVAVSANGDVSPCVPMKLVAGNIREKSIVDIWNNSPVFVQLRKYRNRDLAECNACSMTRHCIRCSALSYNETGDPLSCATLSRQIGGVRKQIAEGACV